MCPVCGKKVGSWHTDGIHPACRKRVIAAAKAMEAAIRSVNVAIAKAAPEMAEAIRKLTQLQRDSILREVNRKS